MACSGANKNQYYKTSMEPTAMVGRGQGRQMHWPVTGDLKPESKKVMVT